MSIFTDQFRRVMEQNIASATAPSNWSALVSLLEHHSKETEEISKSSYFSTGRMALTSLSSNKDCFEYFFKKICISFDAGRVPEDLSSQVKSIKESVKRVFPDKTDPLQKFQRLMHLAHFDGKYRQKLSKFLQEDIVSKDPHLLPQEWIEGYLLLKKYCKNDELTHVDEVVSVFYQTAFRAHYGIPCDQVSRSSALELLLTGSIVNIITGQLSEAGRAKQYDTSNFVISKNPRLSFAIYQLLAQAGEPSAFKCLTRLALDHMQDQALCPSEVEKQKNQLSGKSAEVDKKEVGLKSEFSLAGKYSQTISNIDGIHSYTASILGKPTFCRTGIDHLHIFFRDADFIKVVYQTLDNFSERNKLALPEKRTIKLELKKLMKSELANLSNVEDFLFPLRILLELKIKSKSEVLTLISAYHDAYLNSFTQFGIGIRRDISPTPLIKLADEVYRITDDRDCFNFILVLADRYESNDDKLFIQNLNHAEEIRAFVRKKSI